ncbi:transcription elongation factor S-II [Lineolata rhizophorae]|uniref:Transcription elongation factor n=1 Tax=Lineolata rhizophorae TaxID=578093 RepID=A0A6A6P7S0_9PEZI|nr:transcription elongation factor S-II [Lineolata rhizophorae]
MAMNAKAIDEKGKALTKAFTGGEPSSTLLGLLEDLRRGVQASEDLLRSTRIGITVNRVKQHKDPAVARTASELVGKWRTDVRRAGGTPGGKESGASTPRPASATTTNGASPAPSPAPSATSAAAKPKAKHTVPPEQRSAAADKVDTGVTGNAVRDNCLRLMYDGLSHMSEEHPEDVFRVAREVELACFNKYRPETSTEYKGKIRSLYQNLKNKSNPQLRKRVLSGEIEPARFAVMSHDELKSAERRAEDLKLMKENMNNSMTPQEEKSISASLTCSKCHQKKVSYTQAQTRSADEPMTTFCSCTNCGHRWKFS